MSYESDQFAYKAPPSAEERRLMDMTTEQRREEIDKMEYAAARSEHLRKEAELQRQVETATALSVSRNQQLNHGGQSFARVSGNTTTIEHRSVIADRRTGVDVSNIPLTLGGIQVGPDQARQLVAQGMFSEAEYKEAMRFEAAKRGGVPSFFR